MYSVYILRCSDNSLYTGHTNDLPLRIAKHDDGRACAYTVSRRPVRLVHSEEFRSREAAAKRERQLKRWTRAKKEALIAASFELLKRL